MAKKIVILSEQSKLELIQRLIDYWKDEETAFKTLNETTRAYLIQQILFRHN